MDYFKSVYISAKTGQRTDQVLDIAETVFNNSRSRVSTGQLNDLILDCVRISEPPSYNGRRLKIMYVTENDVNPPSFIFFVNDTGLMHFSYRRYLENCLRRAYDFSGTPIKLSVRANDSDE